MKPQSFSAVSLISQLRIKMSHAGTGKEKGTLQGSPLQHHMCNHIRIFISLALVVPLDSFLFFFCSYPAPYLSSGLLPTALFTVVAHRSSRLACNKSHLCPSYQRVLRQLTCSSEPHFPSRILSFPSRHLFFYYCAQVVYSEPIGDIRTESYARCQFGGYRVILRSKKSEQNFRCKQTASSLRNTVIHRAHYRLRSTSQLPDQVLKG
ncbi:hypothetical protein M432DRAFT_450959 [Thermoascus aurantiacus ATCC 26904]